MSALTRCPQELFDDNYPVEFSFSATRHQTVEWGQVFTPKRNGRLQGTGTIRNIIVRKYSRMKSRSSRTDGGLCRVSVPQ